MKMTTGRIANPRKRRAPAKRKTATVAKRRRRRANPGHMRAVIPQAMITRSTFAPELRKANPRRRKVAAHSSSGIFVSPSGRTLTRRANPSGPGVVAGVSITETALMVLSGGAAAFAGAVAVRFVDEKLVKSKWGRVGVKTGAALVIGFVGMKAAESQAMGGRIVLPIAIGFAAPMIASAINDIFDTSPVTRVAPLKVDASAPSQVALVDDDEDDDDTIDGLDPIDDIDDDVASLYESGDLDDDDDDMDGFGPQSELMGSTVMSNPARGLSSFAANFMQGISMARA
jgi:hypothetical protein